MILSAEYAYRPHDHVTVTAQMAAATATLRPGALLNACLPITIAAYEFHGACTSAFAAIQLLDLHTLFYSPKPITCLLCINRKCCFPPDLESVSSEVEFEDEDDKEAESSLHASTSLVSTLWHWDTS